MIGRRARGASDVSLPTTMAAMNSGVMYGVLAFLCWGLYPLYFREVAAVAPFEVVLHRALWSLLLLAAWLAYARRWQWLGALRGEPRQIGVYALSAVLIGSNWLVYVWAVANGHVLQASLGYFINPIVNVALGVLVLGERLRRAQWLAVALAAAGVAWLTWAAGELPWIALACAGLFALYGLVRKTSRLGPLEGLSAETALMALPALPLLLWWTATQPSAGFASGDATLIGWLVLAGPVTVLPLVWFTAAARRLPLATLGLLQYISPSMQFVLGVWVFGEAFDTTRLIGFALIWSALALYSADLLGAFSPRGPRQPAPEPPR
jgi:chloramphenicol-sensitive protein RarD